jgi:CheY-like chemotaxis protein
MTKERHAILVVDDDEVVRRFVATTLQRNGYAVFEAGSGIDGIQRFEEHGQKLSLILTDIMMPGMTGLEMVEKIRASHGEPCVMFMTGGTSVPELPRGEVARYQLLYKPFTTQHLLKTINDCLTACQ